VSDGHFEFHISLIFAEVKIPVIVVLTKYDLLVMEHYRACSHLPVTEKKAEAAKLAKHAFSEVTRVLKVPFVPVSTKKDALKDYGGMLF
jgi:hypothetical protein